MNIREGAITDLMEYKGFDRLPTEYIIDRVFNYLKAEIEKHSLTDEEIRLLPIKGLRDDSIDAYQELLKAYKQDILKLLEEK